jgi:hypothetical protein
MILNFIINLLKILLIICVLYPISHGNIGFALLISTLCFLDYQVWIRGGNSYLFEDKTEIEKDLRKIQKLEIKKKLEELKK